MSSKGQAACKTVAVKNSRHNLESYKEPSPVTEVTSEGLARHNNCCTIKVTVQTKGRKRTSKMVSSSPSGQKMADHKRKPIGAGEPPPSWGRILREQNRPTVKQGFQQLAVKSQTSSQSRQVTESKETKKHKESLPSQSKYDLNKHLDEISGKQPSSQRRAEEKLKHSSPHTGIPSSASIGSSGESIIVVDRAVQCGGILDYSEDRFGAFSPVHTLGFLIKKLERLVKDENASKILADMEQVLYRLPVEAEKPPAMDLEAIAIRRKLEATTIQLEETSKKMNTTCEALREDRDSLQRQVKTLKQDLERAMKMYQAKEETSNQLKEEIKSYERIIADLRTSLNEQTELARQRQLEMQYLTLEKDKLSVLSSYKDTLLLQLRNAVKDVQNHIAEQLTGMKEAYTQEERSNPQMSIVHGGIACSSPTSTSSRESNTPTSWQDISDVSLSTVDPNQGSERDADRFIEREDKIVPSAEKIRGGAAEKKRTKVVKESRNKDSAHLEFVSLPGGSGNTIFLPSYRDPGCSDSSLLGKKNDTVRQSKDAEARAVSVGFSRQSPERTNDKETNRKSPQKHRKSTEASKKQQTDKPSSVGGISKILKTNFPNPLISSTITEQFQNMFDDIRLQTKIPVNVPSPPRNYPNPDFSDSTLPSISAVSEINTIQ